MRGCWQKRIGSVWLRFRARKFKFQNETNKFAFFYSNRVYWPVNKWRNNQSRYPIQFNAEIALEIHLIVHIQAPACNEWQRTFWLQTQCRDTCAPSLAIVSNNRHAVTRVHLSLSHHIFFSSLSQIFCSMLDTAHTVVHSDPKSSLIPLIVVVRAFIPIYVFFDRRQRRSYWRVCVFVSEWKLQIKWIFFFQSFLLSVRILHFDFYCSTVLTICPIVLCVPSVDSSETQIKVKKKIEKKIYWWPKCSLFASVFVCVGHRRDWRSIESTKCKEEEWCCSFLIKKKNKARKKQARNY